MYALLYIWAKINKQKNKLDKSSLKIKLAAIKNVSLYREAGIRKQFGDT